YRKKRDSDVGTHCTNSNNGRLSRECPGGITGILWTEHGEHVPQGGGACGQNPARHEARRHSRRAGNQIRFVSQRSDRASTRPRRARCAARPRRRGDRMKRREFITLLGGAAAAWPLAARAQQPGTLPHIGVLVSASPPHPFADAFWRGLHALGYSEGRNIKVEFRYTDGRSDRAEEFAAAFVRSGVDVIVAHFNVATRAAMGATRTIPIVMAAAGAPLQQGLIDSLARPGGNVTGLSAMDAELGGKRLQLLRELMPNLLCIGVLAATPATDGGYGEILVKDLDMAATRAGLRLAPVLVEGPNEFEGAFEAMFKVGAQAVIT